MHKCKTSSLRGVDLSAHEMHSSKWCLINYKLHIYANGTFVLTENCDLFEIADIAPDVRMILSGSLSFTKRTFVGWMSES